MQWHDKTVLIASKYIIIIVILSGCGSEQPTVPPLETEGTWQQVISGVEAHSVVSGEGIVLAGTDNGAYRKEIATPQGEWSNIGLQIDSSAVVDFVILKNMELMAAVEYDQVRTGKPTLYRSNSGGAKWEQIDVDVPDAIDYFAIKFLEKSYTDESKLFAYVGYIVQSEDQGNSWQIINDDGGFKEFLKVSPYHPEQIWSGGWVQIFAPSLIKSVNGGNDWTMLNQNIDFNTDATVYDVILSSEKSELVLAGFGGAVSSARVIRKSTDGGQTWRTVLEEINIRTFTHGARHPEIVYASGRQKGDLLFFNATNDFGESWEQVTNESVPPGITINDLVAVESSGQEILYLATDRGLYSYTFTQ